MDYQVELSRSARSDLEDITRYISIDDPDRALRFGRFLIQHTKSLGQFPARGRIVPEFEDETIREIIVRAYRVVIASITNSSQLKSFAFGTPAEALLSS